MKVPLVVVLYDNQCSAVCIIVTMTIIKSPTHADLLVRHVAALLDQQQNYWDITAVVGTQSFRCHRLVLSLRSNYFEKNFFSLPSSSSTNQITISNVNDTTFHSVLCYMYKGELELNDKNVEDIYKAADEFELDDLKQICVDFMIGSMTVKNCIRFWKLADSNHEKGLAEACKETYLKLFDNSSRLADLCHLTEEMMKAVLGDDGLQADREVDVCEMLMKWLDIQTQRGQTVNNYEFLTLIRWSDVPLEYIKDRLLNKDILIRDRQSFEFLSKVMSYRRTGIQFPGFRTFNRPSTQREMCVIVVGITDGLNIKPEAYRVSLQRSVSTEKLPNIPILPQPGIAACMNSNGALYVTGLGHDMRQTWMWNIVSGWARCGDLVGGRVRHCATFVNNTDMYVLGGFDTKITLNSLEQYTTTTNRWRTVGELVHDCGSAACVVHRTSILVFGGSGIDHAACKIMYLDSIQVYDTVAKTCTLLTQRLPRPTHLLRAVMWDNSVILINHRTCLVFELEQRTFQPRDQFATGVAHFGLVLENENLFVIGGGKSGVYKSGKTAQTWMCSNVVRRVPVMDIINNKTTPNWIEQTKLPQPSLVHAVGCCTLPL